MPWRRIVIWSASTVLLVALAATVFLFTVDLGFLKPEIEARLTRASGRELTIGGDLILKLGRRATLVADEVRWQNAPWAGTANMLEVGHIEAELDLLSLLREPVLVERLLVRDARLELARNADLQSNWAIFEPQADAPRQESDDRAGVLLRQLDLENINVLARSPARAEPIDIRLQSMRQAVRPDDVVSSTLEATVNGRAVSATATVATWSTLLEQGRIVFDVGAKLDTVTLESNGVIDSLATPRRPAVEFSIRGPAVGDLFRLAGLGEHGIGDVDLEGTLKPDGEGLVLGVEGNLGRTRIAASGSFSDLRHLDQVDVAARADGPNLGRVLGLFGIDDVSEVPFALAVDLERRGRVLTVGEAALEVGDARLSLEGELPAMPSLANSHATIRAAGPRIEELRRLLPLPAEMRGPFSAAVELDADGRGNERFRANARTTLGKLEVSGTLGPAPRHFGSRAQIRYETDSLAGIGALMNAELPADTPATLTGDLELTQQGLRTRDATVVTVGKHTARIDGLFGMNASLTGTHVGLHLAGDSLADLGRSLHAVDGLPELPYEVDAELHVDAAAARFGNVVAKLGDATLVLDAHLTRQRDFAGSRFSVSFQGPALEALVPAIADRRIRPGSFRAWAEGTLDDDMLRLGPLELEREFAEVAADLELGWPPSFDEAAFDVEGRGPDVRALLGTVGPLHLEPLPYSVAARGSRRGERWTFERVEASLGDARLDARGTVDYGDAIAATQLAVSSLIPNVAALGTLDGQPLRDRYVSLDAVLVGRHGTLAIDDLDLRLDEGRIRGSVELTPGMVPELNADLRADSLALHPLAKEATAEAPALPDDGRLIPNTALPLDALEKLNGSLRLSVGKFRRGTLNLGNVDVRAELHGGTLELRRLGFDGRSGRLDATARLEPGSPAELALSATARDFVLGLEEANRDRFFTTELEVDIRSRGDGLRELAANANGIAFLDARGGRMRNYRALRAVYGNLLDEMLTTINPFHAPDEYTLLECVVLPLRFTDGNAASTPGHVFITDKVQIVSRGSIDLGTESVDLSFRTLPREVLGISAAEIVNPYVKIVGTLAKPRLGLQQKNALVAGGAAVTTGGLSILAKATWDRLSRTADPCAAASDQAREAFGADLPEPPSTE